MYDTLDYYLLCHTNRFFESFVAMFDVRINDMCDTLVLFNITGRTHPSWGVKDGLPIYERQIHHSEITACVLRGLVPKSSVVLLVCTPNFGQVVTGNFHCLLKTKLLFYSQDNVLFLARPKISWKY